MDVTQVRQWALALAALPTDRRARVELELAHVEEMATPDAVAHLVDAAGGRGLPPERIAAGAPVALWFLVHRPNLFREVLIHEEVRGIASWRVARAPSGIDLTDARTSAPALAEAVRTVFQVHEGVGRFGTAEVYRLAGYDCFVVRLADRPHVVEAFTEQGSYIAHRMRPAVQVTFAYDPHDGTIFFQCRLRTRDRLFDLVQRFASTVLGVQLHEDCLAPTFNLEPLKRPFTPLPDAPDMESVRVKTLRLRYPDRAGRRIVSLQSHAGDGDAAVTDLLRTHLCVAGVLDQLDVCYAEIQVRLRVEGGAKSYLIRLSPDRCNLDRTALGERLRACLRRWGLCHAH